MKSKVFKKLVSVMLVVLVMLTMSISAIAADPEVSGTQDNNTSGSGSTVPVVVTAEAPVFKAVVPLALPVHVAADGTVTTATNATIVNQSSFGSIEVKAVVVTPAVDWTIDAFTDKATYGNLAVNAKTFGYQINTCSAAAGTGTVTVDATNFPTIAIGAPAAMPIVYAALFAPQATGLTDVTVGTVTITIGWDD